MIVKKNNSLKNNNSFKKFKYGLFAYSCWQRSYEFNMEKRNKVMKREENNEEGE